MNVQKVNSQQSFGLRLMPTGELRECILDLTGNQGEIDARLSEKALDRLLEAKRLLRDVGSSEDVFLDADHAGLTVSKKPRNGNHNIKPREISYHIERPDFYLSLEENVEKLFGIRKVRLNSEIVLSTRGKAEKLAYDA